MSKYTIQLAHQVTLMYLLALSQNCPGHTPNPPVFHPGHSPHPPLLPSPPTSYFFSPPFSLPTMSSQTSSSTPFINHGLGRWLKARASFLRPRTSSPPPRICKPVDVEVVIDAVHNKTRSEEFDSVSLPMMVCILNDLWEAEGS